MAAEQIRLGMRGKDWVRCGVLAVSALAVTTSINLMRPTNVSARCTEKCTPHSCGGGTGGVITAVQCRDCSVTDTACCLDAGLDYVRGECTTCGTGALGEIHGSECLRMSQDGFYASDAFCCPS
jgi:hypothetical protein